MHKTVERGIQLGLVRYVETNKGIQIEYIQAKRKYPIGKPEEWVRLLSYLHLTMVAQHPPENIALEYAIKMGSSYRYADIVVFENATHQKPLLLVECKRENSTQQAFEEAEKQAFSYCRQISPQYVWVTTGAKGFNSYYQYRADNFVRMYALPSVGIWRHFWQWLKGILYKTN